MEAMGTLAGGIAHDFNNILGVMLGYTEMALSGVAGKSHLERKLNQVLKAGQRAKDLVSQILAFSRPDKKEQKVVRISSVIKEALKMLRATLPATIEIRQDIATQEDRVLAESHRDPSGPHQSRRERRPRHAREGRGVDGEFGLGISRSHGSSQNR